MRLNALVVVFICVVALAVGMFMFVSSVESRFETRVCRVVMAVTAPVPPAPVGTDAATLGRINARNLQLAGERATLLDVLDKPKGC